MTRNGTTDARDLASRAQALRMRITTDERKLATAYPDQVEGLEADLDRERGQLAELDQEIEAAKDEARKAMADAVDAYFASRDALMKLSGYFHDPGFKHPTFARTALTMAPSLGPGGGGEIRADSQPTNDVRAALLQATEVAEAPEQQVPEVQRIHEERLRNERAGLGYLTDREIADVATRGEAAKHGAGWSRMRRETMPGS